MSGSHLKGIPRLHAACVNSLAGLKAAWKSEEAFRQECILLLLGGPLALLLGQNGIERALLIGVLLLVIITELVNTAIETTIDRISPEHHALSARAKDLGSAAVMMSLALVVVTWILILMP